MIKHDLKSIIEYFYMLYIQCFFYKRSFILLFFLYSLPIFGQKLWKLSDNLIPYVDVDSSYKQVPSINSPEDLEKLFNVLHKFYPFQSLQAIDKEMYWLISGSPAKKIKNIEMNFVTRKAKISTQDIKDEFLGKTDSQEKRDEFIRKLKNKLNKKSFFDSIISFSVKEDDNFVYYHVSCNEGYPYRVSGLDLKDFFLEEKIICDEELIENKLEEFESQKKKEGYLDAQISLKMLEIDEKNKICFIKTKGSIGNQFRFEIFENEKFYSYESSYIKKILESINVYNDPISLKEELFQFYQSQGYRNVKISKQFLEKENIIQFKVETGNLFKIRKIDFHGNYFFSYDYLIQEMRLQNFWNTKQNFIKQDILNSIYLIEKKYKENGFWNIKIDFPLVRESFDSNECDLSFFVFEGKQTIVDSLKIEGNIFFEKEEIEQYLNIPLQMGLNPILIQDSKEKIENSYITKGFLDPKISFFWTKKENEKIISLNGILKIEEGYRYKIRSINFNGLSKTHSDVLIREIKFRPGDWYIPDEINETRQNLINLGVFSFVQIHIVTDLQSGDVDLMIEVKESSSIHVSFGPGFDTKKGLNYSMLWSWNNISGKNRQLTLNLKLSEEKNQYLYKSLDEESLLFSPLVGRKVQVSYLEPYIWGGGRIDGVFNISHSANAGDIINFENTVNFGLLRKFRHKGHSMALSYFYNIKNQEDVGSIPQKTHLVSTGSSLIGSLSVYFQMDYRNVLDWPSDGFFSSSELEYANTYLLGQYHFLKFESRHTQYLSFLNKNDDLIFKISLLFQSYYNLPSKNIKVLPVSLRMPGGGAQLVRGFQLALGPYVSDNEEKKYFLNGNNRFIYKNEIRYRFTKKINAGFFFDMGNVFISDNELKKFSCWYQQKKIKSEIMDNFNLYKNFSSPLENFYGSYGVFSGYITPIGSVGIDLSWGLFEPKNYTLSRKKEKSYIPDFGISIGNEA